MSINEVIYPKVSVCIPTYNYGHYISDAIESVLCQTYKDFNLIIIDNCSNDNTRDVVGKYVGIDNRVKYICNEGNLGLTANLNRCLDYSSGEYVKIVCSDDVLQATCLEKMINILDVNPNVSLVASARQVVDKFMNPERLISYWDSFKLLTGTTVIKKCFFNGNLIGEPTAVLFRKKDASRGFNHKYKQIVDLEMWFHLLEKGDFAFIPEALCLFRHHEGQESLKNVSSLAFIDDEILLHDDYINKKYIGKTFINEEKWKFWLSYNIWSHKSLGVDRMIINSKIADNYPLLIPLLIFYFLVFMRITKHKIRFAFFKIKRIMG